VKALFDEAYAMLQDRATWEQKQKLYYRMRHNGLPRLNKPFPTAADLHYPEIDMAIRRLKPFWIGQATAGDRLCNFTSLQSGTNVAPNIEGMADAAADYYSFESTQRSNFMDEIERAVDFMLLRGRGVLKCTVDPLDKYKLVDEAIDPFYILMPEGADDFEDADHFVHVRQFSVAAYKRLDSRWDTSPETIARIRGGDSMASTNSMEQEKRTREGITHTLDTNTILVWEHYTKTVSGWTINTYSPQAPEIQLRQAHAVPFKVNGKASCPFFSFPMELKDKGWYSPRGLGELLGPVESYMCKVWNEKADSLTLSNRQMFTGEKEIQNFSNYRMQHGEYIPGNIKSVQFAPGPMSFDQEIMFARSIGEQQSQSPDFGIVNSSGQGDSKGRTATENNRIAALQQAGTDHNGASFRRRLGKVHRHRWGICCQYKERDFVYLATSKLNTLPQQALHDKYLIEPDGSPEGWNRTLRFQKAMAGMQSFGGNPFVNMEPITREALAAWDGRMVQKAFVPANLKGKKEAEDEVQEINSLLAPPPGRPSFPASVEPGEDHVARTQAIIQWLEACMHMNTPVDPIARQRVQQHLAEHLQILQQQNPAAAKQVKAMLAQFEQQSAQQPQAPAPGAPPAQLPAAV
jgi:hypothetical protein